MRKQPVALVVQPKLCLNAHHELLPCDDTEKLAARRHPIRHPVRADLWGYIEEVRASHLVRCVPQLSQKSRSGIAVRIDTNCHRPLAIVFYGRPSTLRGVAELYA
jgi:hypothetical protein